MKFLGDIGKAIKAVSFFRKMIKTFREAKMLPDKPAVKSATIWGKFIQALGMIAAVAGAATMGEVGWDEVLTASTTQAGAIVTAIGWLIGSIGKRRSEGAKIEAAKNGG